MLPILKIPNAILVFFSNYRSIFHTESSYRHVGKYITNLLINPNKTLQGAYSNIIDIEKPVSRRAMHHGVFKSNWSEDKLFPKHREIISKDHQGQYGQETISLDWTFAHHARGPKIYGNKIMYDYGKNCYSLLQTILTATAVNKNYIDGIYCDIHIPSKRIEEEEIYLKSTKKSCLNKNEAITRFKELLYHKMHKMEYKKKSDLFIDMINKIEDEGNSPHAHYAFDNGVLNLGLSKCIEGHKKHWVSELETSRLVSWKGEWLRLDKLSSMLKEEYPQAYKTIKFIPHNGKEKTWRCFSKVLKLKNGYEKKRIVICYENENLERKPRFLVTDAKHWCALKVLKTWSYRWPCEIFHEFAKQDAGLESSQVRKEKSVKRHFSLSYISQSILQRVKPPVSKSERFKFADGNKTIGQNTTTLVRNVFKQSIELTIKLSKEGRSANDILGILMPV